MGNDKLAFMTNQRDYELRIDFINTAYQPYYTKYDLFRIADKSNKYRLVGLGNYTGNAGSYILQNIPYKRLCTSTDRGDQILEKSPLM